MRRFLLLFATVFLSVAAFAATTELATWTFTSASYPAKKTYFKATGGTCPESTFYLNGSGAQWNTSAGKGYAFTAVTDITLTLKTTVAIPQNTVISFAADMFYNKASNTPVTEYTLTVKENGGDESTTGLDKTSIPLSNSKATNTVNYTTQTNLAAGATIEFIYSRKDDKPKGSGQAYFGNIVISTEAELGGGGETPTGLSLSADKTEMTLGEDAPVLTLTPNDVAVTWSSSREDVATVDQEGVVKVTGVGETTIKAVDNNDASNFAQLTLTVKDPNLIEHVLTTSEFPGNNAYKTVRKYTAPHGIVYVAQFFESNGIQLNSKPESPGIVVTANPDGYILSKVTVTWNANCTAGRSLEIYGSNEAYTATSELKATATNTTPEKGTKIGSLTSAKGTETELDVTGAYRFIGIRALEAVNIDKITLVWVVPAPEFKADITIAVDETEGGANVVSFSNLAVSNGVEFDFTGYNVKLNGTEIGSAANGETISYLPFLPTGEFTISNGTNTYPVVVTWPITDFSTIQAKVTGVEYWALQDNKHAIDANSWYLDADYTIAPDCEVPNLYFEMTCSIFDEASKGKIVKVDGSTVSVANVGFFMVDNGQYDYTTIEDGAFNVTLNFPFFVNTALKGLKAPSGTEKITIYTETETLIDVTDNTQVAQPNPSAGSGNISGVESVVVDNEGAVEYFNLQGVRVQGTLAPGIYIRRSGNTATKVAIR